MYPTPVTRRAWGAALPLLCVAVLALGGCAGGSDDGTDAYADRVFERSPKETFEAELWGEAALSPDEEERAQLAGLLEWGTVTAECMADQGFEYIPWVSGVNEESVTWEAEMAAEADRLTSVEFAERYGYGPLPPTFADDESNPNEAILAAMSEAEQAAYDEALNGHTYNGDDIAAASPEELGCSAWAAVRTNGPTERGSAIADLRESPDFMELENALARTSVLVLEATDTTELNHEWRTCMDGAGYGEFGEPNDAHELVSTGYSEAYDRAHAKDPTFTWETFVQSDEVSDLREAEIPLATADARCQEETDYVDRFNQIRWRLEQNVLDDHADLVESVLASLPPAG
ncbi:hypothetical protein [Salana multivorans]